MTTDPAFSTSGPRRAIIAVLAVGYGSFLAFVAFWPSPVDRPVAGLLARVIRELHERGVPRFVDYGFIEFTANIALFVPVGILLGLIGSRRLWPFMLLVGPLLSGIIEAAQLFVLSQRYATVEDVIANSLGSTIGVLLAVGLRTLVARRDARVVARDRAMGGAWQRTSAPASAAPSTGSGHEPSSA